MGNDFSLECCGARSTTVCGVDCNKKPHDHGPFLGNDLDGEHCCWHDANDGHLELGIGLTSEAERNLAWCDRYDGTDNKQGSFAVPVADIFEGEKAITWYDAHDGQESEQDSLSLKMTDILEAGVPLEYAEKVARMRAELHCGVVDYEPLCDPITLLRFLVARSLDVERAIAMHRSTVKWRREYHLAAIMGIFGGGESYRPDGNRSNLQSSTEWNWEPRAVSYEAELRDRHGFFGRLKQKHPVDGGSILIWRVGIADIASLRRESLLEGFKRALVAHMEDTLQALRAESLKRKAMVRCVLIIDAHGLGITFFKHLSVIKELLSFCADFFPDVMRSATVVRAPWLGVKLGRVVLPFMPEDMSRKFLITGENFCKDLKAHSGIDKDMLPAFLGGKGSDIEVCAARPVPLGLGRTVADQAAKCKQLVAQIQDLEKAEGG